MAASRSMGAFAGPTTGAQSPVVAPAPMAQVPPSGPPSFSQVLQSMVPPMQAMPMQAMQGHAGTPMQASQPPMQGHAAPRMPRMPSDGMERPNIAALAQHMARAKAPPPTATVFKAGVPGTPEGPTGIEIARDHADKISGILAELRAQNPNRKIKAPAFVDAWNAKHPDLPLNFRRGRTALARVQAAEERQQIAALEKHLMRGALGALKTGSS